MAFLCKADGTTAIVKPAKGATFALDELQGYVGGYLEIVRCLGGYLIVNDNGLNDGLPLNVVATTLYGQQIVGDAVLCSPAEID